MVGLTLFTPVRPQWAWLLERAFHLARHLPKAHRDVLKFNFIHYVRWAVLRKDELKGERLNYRYLYFESNFDGPWQHYIDAFAYVIPHHIRTVWGRGPAFPAPPPAEPLKAWIARNSMEGGHYYCAYPHASTRMVKSALNVRDRLAHLVDQSESLDPEAFAAAYRRFLTDVQADL
jgi:hypothetical protein